MGEPVPLDSRFDEAARQYAAGNARALVEQFDARQIDRLNWVETWQWIERAAEVMRELTRYE